MDNTNNEQKSKLIKLAIYIGIFLIAIIVVLFDRGTNKTSGTTNNNQHTSTNDPKIIETIKNINDEYYISNVHLTLDDDAISLNYERSSNLEMGIKKYHGTNTEYVKNNNDYYKFKEGVFTKLNNFTEFDYDKTFIEIENIKKLLEVESTNETYTSNNLDVLKKTFNTKDVLKIYNEYNNTNFLKYDEGKITLEIYYKDNTLNHIVIDTTNLYNFINKTTQNKVEYTLTYESQKETDNSWILEKLN